MLATESGRRESVPDPLSREIDDEQEPGRDGLVEPLGGKPQTSDASIALDFGSSALSRDSNDSDEPGSEAPGLETYASYGQLVGPPSYEESALYDSVVNASTDNGTASAAAVAPCSALSIAVSDPQRREQTTIFGIQGGYMQYKISTVSKLSSYKNSEAVVRRRFREFVALDQMLKTRFRGYFIPPRPEKNAVEGQRMKECFIEERRVALEKYLNRLAGHTEIGPSEELRIFLEEDGNLSSNLRWQALQPPQQSFLEGAARFPKQLFGKDHLPQPTEVVKSAKKSNDLMRMMREGVQGIKNELTTAVMDMRQDEKELRYQAKSLETMWDQLADTSRVAEVLVKKFERHGAVLGDLGLSFIKLSKYEETEGTDRAQFTDTVSCAQSLSTDTKQCGIALIRLARLAHKVTNKMAQDLGELHDYMFFMPSVTRALTSREQAMLTLQTLESQQAAKNKAADELKSAADVAGGNRGKSRREQTVRSEIAGLDSSILAANAQYEKIKSVNFQELDRFKAQKAKDFMDMLRSLACVQAAYAERSAEVWATVAREMGATDQQVAESKAGIPSKRLR